VTFGNWLSPSRRRQSLGQLEEQTVELKMISGDSYDGLRVNGPGRVRAGTAPRLEFGFV
jgi:hypothetical protein